MTKEEFLKDTINFYNSNNRSVYSNLRCLYLSLEDGKKCAIGRFLKKEDAITADEKGYDVDEIIKANMLPERISKLGIHFLETVQDLHDTRHYWAENGLTLKGKNRVNSIIRMFNLNMTI